MVTRFACIAHRLQSSNKCTMKSSVACSKPENVERLPGNNIWVASKISPTSCMARRASAVQRNGSGAKMLVISRHCSHAHD